MQFKQLEKVLVLDIETVPMCRTMEELSPVLQEEWKRKQSRLPALAELSPEDGFAKAAGIYAEFGKIICVVVGELELEVDHVKTIHLQTFASSNEVELLMQLSDFLKIKKQYTFIAGHNIREFDVPFLCRRFLINQLPLPTLFNITGKKMYELDFLIDSLQLWKFGDYKHYTSLSLLCEVNGIESPKTNLDGSKVAATYWQENKLSAITHYCEQDLVASAQLIVRLLQFRLAPNLNVIYEPSA